SLRAPRGKSLCHRKSAFAFFGFYKKLCYNAAKYSAVRHIEVQPGEASSDIHLLVHDLGRGFDLETARQGGGLCLMSMQERVRLVNGTVEIQAKPRGG